MTGTRVRYWADPQIFVKGSHFSLDDLTRRSRQTAFLVPGLKISVSDLRPEASPDQPTTRVYKYDGGISEFVEYLAQDQKITDVIRASRQEGMQDFNQSLCDLVKRGLVSEQVALETSPNPEQLAMNLKGITLGSDRGSISGGTISGIGRFLKERDRRITVIGIEPLHSSYRAAVTPALALGRLRRRYDCRVV